MIDHEYVTMKLTNGDNIIAVVVSEDDESFTIMFPVQMKIVRVELKEGKKEVLAGTPWIPHTDEKVFNIFKQDIIAMSLLNSSTIEYYKNLVDVSVSPQSDIQETDLINELSDKSFFVSGSNTKN
jgi:hypothetical protein